MSNCVAARRVVLVSRACDCADLVRTCHQFGAKEPMVLATFLSRWLPWYPTGERGDLACDVGTVAFLLMREYWVLPTQTERDGRDCEQL